MSEIKYPCARCGRAHAAEWMTYSRWSGKRYCRDTLACMRRMKRLAREGAQFDRGWLVG